MPKTSGTLHAKLRMRKSINNTLVNNQHYLSPNQTKIVQFSQHYPKIQNILNRHTHLLYKHKNKLNTFNYSCFFDRVPTKVLRAVQTCVESQHLLMRVPHFDEFGRLQIQQTHIVDFGSATEADTFVPELAYEGEARSVQIGGVQRLDCLGLEQEYVKGLQCFGKRSVLYKINFCFGSVMQSLLFWGVE